MILYFTFGGDNLDSYLFWNSMIRNSVMQKAFDVDSCCLRIILVILSGDIIHSIIHYGECELPFYSEKEIPNRFPRSAKFEILRPIRLTAALGGRFRCYLAIIFLNCCT